MLHALNAVFSDSNSNTIYWVVYQVLLILFLIVFLFIYHRGKSEYRPYTHQRFERLRIASVVALLFDIIFSLQFILKNIKIVSIVFGSLSATIIAIIVCMITTQIIRNYFALKSQDIPQFITYYLYSWLMVTFLNTICQLLSFSLDTEFVNELYKYFIYVDTVFNVTFFILLILFIVLFILWILIQHHRINFVDNEEANQFGTPSDITTGGENDITAQTFLLRLIGLLCAFCIYFGFIVASNIYSLSISDKNNYDKYQIILHFICEKTVLFFSLMIYLVPRPDNYLSVSPNILNSLHINTESNRQKKSTFKDPNASDKWDFHAGHHSADTSYRDDDYRSVDYDDNDQPEWDKESQISYTTLMFRKDQQKLAKSAPKEKNWLSYFTPSSSHHGNSNNTDDILINVPQKKLKKKKKAPRIKKKRYSSQAEAQQNNEIHQSESLQSIQSMYSNEDK